MKHKSMYFYFIILFTLIALIPKVIGIMHESNKKHLERSDLLLDSIYSEIIQLEIQHPTIVYSQVLLESNYATSNLFIKNNNLFGMKPSGSRATTSNVIIGEYKYYRNWRESLIDYALLQMAYYRNLSEEEYLEKLSLNYASDSLYSIKINKLKNNLK